MQNVHDRVSLEPLSKMKASSFHFPDSGMCDLNNPLFYNYKFSFVIYFLKVNMYLNLDFP